MSATTVIVSYQAQPGQAEVALDAIQALVATVLAREPACAGITVLQDAADPTRIKLIEQWPSQDMFLGPHMQEPHIRAFIEQAGAFLAGPPDISFWNRADAG